MPVDITLVRAALRALKNCQGRDDVTEEVLGYDVEAILRRPVISHQLRGALVDMKTRGWVTEDLDTWGLPTWSITDAGINESEK